MKLLTTHHSNEAISRNDQGCAIPLSHTAWAARQIVGGVLFGAPILAAYAGSIPLAQQPAGTAGREPAPNVIMSIDDSGSMGGAVGGGYNNSKMSVLKTALIAQFGNPTANPPTKGKLEDGRIRLAWQSMCRNPTQITPGQGNSMKSFEGQHRVNFYNYVTDLTPNCGTPSHRLMKQALDYMRSPQGTNSPWADAPGTPQSTPYMACRRTYNIFMTDGGWNSANSESVGNADGTTRTLGDGTTVYDTTSNQTRIYRDAWGGPAMNQLSTLADFTFAAWATDLQDGNNGTANMANSIQPLIRKSGVEAVGATNLQEYWNPKNDPANWQHIVTHTIGFGSGAYQWKNNSNTTLIAPFWDNATDSNYGGDYSSIVNGTTNWPNPIAMNENGRPFELWHMALNGRGKFYPARSADALSAAFADILDNVINDTSKPVVSVSANSTRVRTGSFFYSAGYDGQTWSGYLKAYPVTSAGGVSTVDTWNAATVLDATTPSSRVILTHNGTVGIPFQWTSMPSAAPNDLQTILNAGDAKGSARIDYLRGLRTGEGADVSKFRMRDSALGDIVNSNIWYVGGPSSGIPLAGYSSFASTNKTRTPMIYVGGNDGMLHGFQASTGEEKIAYVPLGAYPKLPAYTNQGYTHKYFVDSSPFSGDIKIGANWKTYLAGFLGGGGKGYFVLDVTAPASFSEGNASSLVVMDNTSTSGTDADIGHIYAQPGKDPSYSSRAVQFTMMNNNRPALVMGNGVNSTDEKAVLLIQYLDGAKELVKMYATSTAGQGNGLMNPQVIDLNEDGKADLIYAGDLLGNLWRFDVSNTSSPGNWKVSFGGNPLFSAKDTSNSPQPILVAPVWLTHPLGGIQLGFSTGRLFTAGDRTDVSEQSFYSVWDKSLLTFASGGAVTVEDDASKRITTGRGALVKETMDTSAVASHAGNSFFNYTPVKVNYLSTGINPNRRGWYMNFTDAGERGSSNPSWYSGNYVMVPSAVPASGTDSNTETCSLASKPEVGYLTIVDLISGSPPKKPVYDTNGGGFTGSEVNASKISNLGDSVLFESGNKLTLVDGKRGANPPPEIAKFIDGGLTTGWRER